MGRQAAKTKKQLKTLNLGFNAIVFPIFIYDNYFFSKNILKYGSPLYRSNTTILSNLFRFNSISCLEFFQNQTYPYDL